MKKHRLFSNGVNKLKSIEELLIVPVWESEWIVIVVVVAAGALRCLWYIFLELRQHIISRISLTDTQSESSFLINISRVGLVRQGT